MVKSSAGISDDDPVQEAVEKLRKCCEDEAVADLLGLASGVLDAVEEERSGQEIAWAARAWADQLADVQPLVLVFEDIHWAEEPLLELIEHLATWVRESPLLLVCLARARAARRPPGLGRGPHARGRDRARPAARTTRARSCSRRCSRTTASRPRRGRTLLAKTEGNPLFVEETIRMLLESDGDDSSQRIPDTLQALIAARIDHLPRTRRRCSTARRDRPDLLARRGRAPRAGPRASDALLDNLLLRDFILARAALDDRRRARLPLQARADPRGRLRRADQGRAGEAARAVRRMAAASARATSCSRSAPTTSTTRRSCRPSSTAPRRPKLASEAAAALEEAGRRALARESNRAARKLLLRAVELEPTLERRYHAARAAWRMSELPAVSVRDERGAATGRARPATRRSKARR